MLPSNVQLTILHMAADHLHIGLATPRTALPGIGCGAAIAPWLPPRTGGGDRGAGGARGGEEEARLFFTKRHSVINPFYVLIFCGRVKDLPPMSRCKADGGSTAQRSNTVGVDPLAHIHWL